MRPSAAHNAAQRKLAHQRIRRGEIVVSLSSRAHHCPCIGGACAKCHRKVFGRRHRRRRKIMPRPHQAQHRMWQGNRHCTLRYARRAALNAFAASRKQTIAHARLGRPLRASAAGASSDVPSSSLYRKAVRIQPSALGGATVFDNRGVATLK